MLFLSFEERGDCVCGRRVYFLAFEERLAGTSKGERLYVVGKLSAVALRRLMKVGAVIVKAT